MEGFTDVGLLRISESVKAYAYLILSSQASVRSSIVENTASALTAQSAFLKNFENVVNRRINIQEDIKRYQDAPSYASSKVDYSVRENIYMLPSDMNLKIMSGTVGYNNKILVSDGKFSLGKNVEVNETPKISHQPSITHGVMQQPQAHRAHEQKPNIQKQTITQAQNPSPRSGAPPGPHEEEKIALVYSLAGGFAIWYTFGTLFDKKGKTHVKMLH